MKSDSSRRKFLAAGLGLPVAGLAASRLPEPTSLPATKPLSAASELKYRILGKTGLKIATVGFGCMITSDVSVLERAIDLGINHFDTARSYQSGNNERMVATALKGKRDKVILSTKSGAKTGAEALEHLNTSLKMLGTDYVDIWYMHGKDNPEAITDDLFEAWETAKKQGKIRFIGLSTHQPNLVADRVLQAGKHEVILVTYNFAVGSASDPSFERFAKAGIGLVAMKVMAPANRAFGFKSDRSDRMTRSGGPSAALKWVLRNERFATTIPSMVDMDQLDVNFRAMSEPYTAEDEKLLASINEQIRPLYCRMCGGCSGQCPKGAPIQETLRYLSYSDFYGQYALGREHFLALPQEQRDVRCGECESCSVQCPNGVHVAERLIRAQEMFA